MGGECNYLLRVNPNTKHLEFVQDDEWMTPEMLAWDEEDIKVWHCWVPSDMSMTMSLIACLLVHSPLPQWQVDMHCTGLLRGALSSYCSTP